MKKEKELSKDAVLREMLAMATRPVNDALRLAFLPQEREGEIKKLDLGGLTEFRRNANGTVEIKFTDRLAVLEALLRRLEEADKSFDGTAAFLRALEESEEVQPAQASRR